MKEEDEEGTVNSLKKRRYSVIGNKCEKYVTKILTEWEKIEQMYE